MTRLSGQVQRSVLRDWVMKLPLREQGTLLTAVRGCDLTPKYPLDSIERILVAAIRYSFMVPADPREVDHEPGCFMISVIPTIKPSGIGHYPHHWVSHIMHAVEVLAYREPDEARRSRWLNMYHMLCKALHVPPEPIDTFLDRMSEDRIASGEVVS
jgi:hypothetical protein